MATRHKLKEEFLTCIVCHEVFRDPVTLHCGHTFCTQCVTAYTKTQKQAIGDKSIPCPCCRGLTKVPDPTRPVDEWAGQFKTGFFVSGLVDAVVKNGNDEEVCTPCDVDGETIPAVYWCTDCGHGFCTGCEKAHRKMLYSKHHEVINLSDETKRSAKKIRKRFPCPKHPDAVIDMMCEDCDVAVCHRCCILHHRKCESVITLEECLPKLKSVIEKHTNDLDVVVKEIKEEMSMKTFQVKEVEKEADDAITTISALSDKVVAEVRIQENKLKEQVRQAKEESLQNLNGDIKSGKMILEEAQQRQGLIGEAMESDVLMNYYEMYKICKSSAVKPTESDTINIKVKGITHLKVDDKSNELISVIREKSYAALSLYGDGPPQIETVSKPTLVKKLFTQTSSIWDILVMTVRGIKTLIVTVPGWVGMLSNCGEMVSFYCRHGAQCESKLHFKHSAYNVTSIAVGKCAVAVHESKQIEFIHVTPDLKRERTVTTQRGYQGLAFLNSTTLVASAYSPSGVIDLIDMSGNVLSSFRSDVLDPSAHLTVTGDNLLIVSNHVSNSVVGVSKTGSIVFQYPQSGDRLLEQARGISHSQCGDIFVADCSSHRVVQLTKTGRYVRDVLTASDGIKYPYGLCVDEDDLMYVIVDHRRIHIYDLK